METEKRAPGRATKKGRGREIWGDVGEEWKEDPLLWAHLVRQVQ